MSSDRDTAVICHRSWALLGEHEVELIAPETGDSRLTKRVTVRKEQTVAVRPP